MASALDSIGSTDVEMHVHSPGGDAFEGLAIMNLLRQHKGDVHLIIDGLAASAASIVAMGADTVTMVPGAQMMIHDASALAIGQADDMRQAADMLDSISSNAADQYAAKSGKPSGEMRAAMKATTWFKAQQAVDAGLADDVLADDDPQTTAAKAATASLTFDLSMFDRAPNPSASKTPAEPPVVPSITPKEADTMSDTLITGLRERFAFAEGADEATMFAKIDAELAANEKTIEDLEAKVDAKPGNDGKVDLKAVVAALEADGKTVVSQNVLAELTAQAQAGAQARAKQLEEERDATIAKAFSDGKISADRREAWKASWDKDPEGTKADLDSLPARFPVGPMQGHQGDPEAHAEVMTEADAEALAALSGTSKEGLLA